MSLSLGYREVIPDQTGAEKWTELTLNTGGTQSTLQDIKVEERTGGYCYKDQSKYFTRNRFIYWRISHDVLELVEHSLDVNLTGNRVRYKFIDTPVLEGITIHETFNSIVVLIATVSSVHRFSFPHPDIIHNQDHVYPRLGSEYSAQSIFAEANLNDARNPATFHVINHTSTNSPLPHTSATGLSVSKQECLFALAYSTGVVLLVKLDVLTGTSHSVELRPQSDTIMPRFLSRAFRGKHDEEHTTVDMLFHNMDRDTYLLCLWQDGNVRLWSTSKGHCTVVTDLVPPGVQGVQSRSLRKAAVGCDDLCLGVLLSYHSHSVVHVVRSTVRNNSFWLQTVASVSTLQDQDVIDFAVTPDRDIWAVFQSVQGETNLSVFRNNDWHACIMENQLDREQIPLDVEQDVKQNYLDFIFHPGRFPAAVINKALSIYRKSNIITDTGVPTSVLRERVAMTVDFDVVTELQERVCEEQEQIEIISTCWQRFYSCCVEYLESGTRPIGLLLLQHHVAPEPAHSSSTKVRSASHDSTMEHDGAVDDTDSNSDTDSNAIDRSGSELVTSGLIIIKKKYISLVRPMDTVETVALTAGVSSTHVKTIAQLCGNEITDDMVKLVKVLAYLDDNLPDEFKVMFDKSVRQLKTPLLAVSELLANELSLDGEDTITNLDILYNVAVNMERISDMEGTLTSLLDLLDVVQPELGDGLENTKWLIHLGHLYGSHLGMSFVSNSVQQMVLVRYELCRCLLLFQHLLQTNSFQQFVKARKFRGSNDLADRTSLLTQCYFMLMWISQTPVNPMHSLESFETCVSMLKLNASHSSWLTQSSYQHRVSNVTILQLFLHSAASASVRLLLSAQGIPLPQLCLWHHSFLPYTHILMQLIWPVCNNTMFPEFLMWSSQYLHVQEYTRLLSRWCHCNSYTRKFLLACTFLDCGEHTKAFDTFNKAMHGVNIDPFIQDKVLMVKENLSKERLVVLYYLKVIKLMEQHGLYDLVIDLAKHGIEAAVKGDPELPTLYSIVFLNHLKLGQFEEAYESLVSNPDSDRRKYCLRQLVVTLFEAHRLDTLTRFTFAGMQDDLERIIEGRARSLDPADNDYYNFLYSFHVVKGSHRKAACVMYEQARRLALDSSNTSVDHLDALCQCYSACINSLSLVPKEDAWMVRPSISPREGHQADRKDVKAEIVVVERKDVLKEYALCRARQRLIRFSPSHTHNMSGSLNVHQVTAVLSNVGLFTEAIGLCKLFEVSAAGVLGTLATTCVRLDETDSDSAWDWLPENEVAELSGNVSAFWSPPWRLLEALLHQHEEPHMSTLHKAVTAKLVHLGVFLPHWLVASYKLRNAPDLLRLLYNNGRLEEAACLAIELIQATLGHGKDRFNIDTSLLPMNPATWLPFNIIDLIYVELEAHTQTDPVYGQLHTDLSQVLSNYLKRAVSVSQDKIKQGSFM